MYTHFYKLLSGWALMNFPPCPRGFRHSGSFPDQLVLSHSFGFGSFLPCGTSTQELSNATYAMNRNSGREPPSTRNCVCLSGKLRKLIIHRTLEKRPKGLEEGRRWVGSPISAEGCLRRRRRTDVCLNPRLQVTASLARAT